MLNLVKRLPAKIPLDYLVKENFKQVPLRFLILPSIVLLLFFCFFAFYLDGPFVSTYIEYQTNLFLKINKTLSVYPNLAYNITQLGDVLIIFPLVFIFLFITPKFWEALLTSSLFTLITSAVLKCIFAVPRPAAVIDINTFTIMGRPNILHTALPSGHSITGFMVMTVILFAFMPQKRLYKFFLDNNPYFNRYFNSFFQSSCGGTLSYRCYYREYNWLHVSNIEYKIKCKHRLVKLDEEQKILSNFHVNFYNMGLSDYLKNFKI
nr:phosphatase PAP2 family protein [Formosa algae]